MAIMTPKVILGILGSIGMIKVKLKMAMDINNVAGVFSRPSEPGITKTKAEITISQKKEPKLALLLPPNGMYK
jgi:hypothetical protein